MAGVEPVETSGVPEHAAPAAASRITYVETSPRDDPPKRDNRDRYSRRRSRRVAELQDVGKVAHYVAALIHLVVVTPPDPNAADVTPSI